MSSTRTDSQECLGAEPGELLVGAQQFIQMFVVALTIFAGILVGYTIVRPEPTR